ncbi:MAG: HAD hydrolase-like protein [Oscillospiraceae bacterium]|nr:HAD hydrolase-like protein [Oscillospiraceae bacterium]
MYHYIFFDLDGTLTDSKEGVVNSVRYAAEKLGGPVPDDTTLLKFIGPPLQDSFMEYCGYDLEKALEAIRVFRERYTPIGQFENRPGPGLAELCRRLKERGYVLALASSKPEEMCVAICGRFGFTPSLAVITGSPPTAHSTKADLIRETMRRMAHTEADRHTVLMVGDRKFDVLGARACGIDCVGVEFFGYAPPGELEEAGAVAVVQTAEELEQFILTH